MLTILPRRWRSITGTTCLVGRKVPRRLIARTIVPVLGPEVLDRRLDGPRRPRAVHQDVDAVERLDGALDHGPDLRLVTDVGGDDEGPAAEGADLGGHRLEGRDLARGEDESAPSPASRSEIARPMPFAAPVTTAVWPASLIRTSPQARPSPPAAGLAVT